MNVYWKKVQTANKLYSVPLGWGGGSIEIGQKVGEEKKFFFRFYSSTLTFPEHDMVGFHQTVVIIAGTHLEWKCFS